MTLRSSPTVWVMALACIVMTSSALTNLSKPVEFRARLYSIDPNSGLKREVSLFDHTDEQVFRLDIDIDDEDDTFGNDTETSLDMVMQVSDSVWQNDSLAVIRIGEEDVVEVNTGIDTDPRCVLTGVVPSMPDSVVTINLCDDVTGTIVTPEMTLDFSNDKIVEGQRHLRGRATPEPENGEFNTIGYGELEEELVADSRFEKLLNSKNRRAPNSISAEVGVYLDKSYVDEQMKTYRRNSNDIIKFIIKKWNLIKGVYGNRQRVGVDFDIQLKYIELWEKTPAFYSRAQSSSKLMDRLRTFCQQHRAQNSLDHKMLYTSGTGGATMGLAYLGGICKPNLKCSLVRAPKSHVRVEIHEFGHNLGFKHEPKMRPCELPSGFMGWVFTYRFQDCYRKYLLSTINSSSRFCLRKSSFSSKIFNN